MKIKIVFVLLLTTVVAFSQTKFGVSTFSMSIKGTSNLHDWESSVKELKAAGVIDTDAAGLNSVKSVSVEIPVKAIKSTKGRVMDNKTYDAFKANDNSFIAYALESATVTKKGDGYDVAASGKLTMAGVTNIVDMVVSAKLEGDGSVTFSGAQKLKLSDFKMKRPSALLGTVTVGDEVEVVFKVSLKPY